MTFQTPDGPPRPISDNGYLDQKPARFTEAGDEHAAGAELSPIGMLCQEILCTVERSGGVSDGTKLSIGTKINNILSMFRAHEESRKSAGRKISTLKSDLRRVTEQLAVLRQEHFGASSEKGSLRGMIVIRALDLTTPRKNQRQRPKAKGRESCLGVSSRSWSSTILKIATAARAATRWLQSATGAECGSRSSQSMFVSSRTSITPAPVTARSVRKISLWPPNRSAISCGGVALSWAS